MEKEGGLIFISHSHQDIEVVRKIRNRFEMLGFEPLMFFLKCLSDEDEIEELIKREIDEREWFVYVDSEHARNSKWVQTERAYIEGLAGKKVLVIDTNRDVIEQTDRIARNLTVFLSYSYADWSLSQMFRKALVDRDYRVLAVEDLHAGDNWKHGARKQINSASKEGFILYLMSKQSAKSLNLQYELEWARKRGGIIIPVLIGDADVGDMPEVVRNRKYVRVSAEPTQEEILAVLRELEWNIFHAVTG